MIQSVFLMVCFSCKYMPYFLWIIYKCMHNSEFIFPWLNRHITIDNPLYSITILSASYGHVTFIASRSCQNLVGLARLHAFGSLNLTKQRVGLSGDCLSTLAHISLLIAGRDIPDSKY